MEYLWKLFPHSCEGSRYEDFKPTCIKIGQPVLREYVLENKNFGKLFKNRTWRLSYGIFVRIVSRLMYRKIIRTF